MEKPSYLTWWLLAIVIVVIGAGLSFARLGPLPELSFSIGPDLTVRSTQGEIEGQNLNVQLQRGDRIAAVSGHAVKDLYDVRSILVNLGQAAATVPDGELTTVVQAVRPLHRFTITLLNEQFDPSMLPPGIEPTDDLVEVDGRALPGKVGPEGLKSIMASRPEAILGFERQNAVFDVRASLEAGPSQQLYLVAFFLAFILIILLARYSSDRLDRRLPAGVALETALVAPVVVLLLKYQWVLADLALTGLVASSIILVRPVAFLGRASAEEDERSFGPLLSLLLAIGAALAVVTLVWRGMLGAERAVQFAAVIGFFYILYELVAGMSRGAAKTVLERGAYLVGIIVVSVLAGLLAYFTNAGAFLERLWADFAAVIIGLVWLSDMVLCLRGPALTGLDEIRTEAQRRELLVDYFSQLELELGASRPRILLHGPDSSVAMTRGITGFEIQEVDQAMRDAMTILVEEGAVVPVPPSQRHTHPLAGIAQTMRMTMALRLMPPEGALEVRGVELIIVALDSGQSNEPSVQAPLEAVELAQDSMNSTVWAAAYVEGLPHLTSESEDKAKGEPSISPVVVEELKETLEDLKEQNELLRSDRSELARQIQAVAEQMKGVAAPALSERERLLEPELVEGLEYLLNSDEPIVLCGPHGAGKSFVAFACHELDETFPGPLGVLDASSGGELPEVEDLDEELFETLLGGALLIRSARLLRSQQIKALAHRAKNTFRLYLAFDEPKPEQRSALDPYTEEVQALLAHRELVLPGLAQRAIRGEIIEFYFERAKTRHRKSIVGIAPGAMEALMQYEFPGEVDECRVMISAAVARCEGEILDIPDFPAFGHTDRVE